MIKLLLTASTVDSSENLIIEEATEKVNVLTRYWRGIDWDQILGTLISKGISLFISLFILLIIHKIGKTLIKNGFEKQRKKEGSSENRIETLYRLANNGFQYTIYFILAYTVLTILGVPVGSLIAGAGIAGIAIGLGAQGFINDILTGFFIILERQLDVGDLVQIEEFEGVVMTVGLRTTQIQSLDGTVHFIPNRNITIISNKSRGNMRVLIQVRMKPDTDTAKAEKIIQKVNNQLVPQYSEITTPPEIVGLVDLGNGNLAIKIVMYTKNGAQFKVQADFLAAYIKELHSEGIEIPQSPLNLTA